MLLMSAVSVHARPQSAPAEDAAAAKAEAAKDTGKGQEKSKARKKRSPAEEAVEEDDFQVSTRKAGTSAGESPETSERLNVVSWKMKRGSSKLDVDRIASVLSTADVSVLQDIEFNENGETQLTVIANILEKRMNERICRGWFKDGKGKRSRFGFVWRERLIGYVEKSGVMHESCSSRPIVMRSEAKDYGFATFFYKGNQRLFAITNVDYESLSKDVEKDITRLFRPYQDSEWAVIYAGDLRTSVKSPAFKDVKKWQFKAALSSHNVSGKGKKAKKSHDNFWYKNISLIVAEPLNLVDSFPELNPGDVVEHVGDTSPIRAEFSFSDSEAQAVQTQLISKKKSKGPASTAAPIVLKGPAYPPPLKPTQLSNLAEDLESEAQSTDPVKEKTAGKTAAKKRKKK